MFFVNKIVTRKNIYLFIGLFWPGASLFSEVKAQFALTPALTNASCPDSADGSLSVTVTGGMAPYTYAWLPGGETTSAITNLAPGTYTLSVTDNNGADTVKSYSVGPGPFNITEMIIPPACTPNGSIGIIMTGASPPYQYAWSNGSSSQSIQFLAAGSYALQVSDSKGCVKNYTYQLVQAECEITPTAYFTPNDDGINDTWYIQNAEYYENARMIVFDRWGSRVHEQRGAYEPWNGKSYLGLPVPSAVYYYFFFKDKDDKQTEALKGSVTIMR